MVYNTIDYIELMGPTKARVVGEVVRAPYELMRGRDGREVHHYPGADGLKNSKTEDFKARMGKLC
jgi:hypothetical protein